MKYRFIYIIMLIGIYISSTNAQNIRTLEDEFIKELKFKTSNIQTINCKFIQTQSLSVLSNKVIKSGKFYYQKPERLSLMFDDGDYIKMTSENFQIKNGDKTNETRIQANPMLRELKKILSACMTGEIYDVKEFYQEIKQDELCYTITMKPKKKRASSKIKEIKLVFDRNDMSLGSMKMIQPNGDYTNYEFFDKSFNKHIE